MVLPYTSKKHFCFVFPIRFGVLVIGLGSAVLSGALAGTVWWFALQRTSGIMPKLTGTAQVAVILAAVVLTAVFICSILGIIGDILARRTLVEIYAISHWITFVLTLAIGTFASAFVISFLSIDNNVCRTFIKGNLTGNCISSNVVKAIWLSLFILDLAVHLHGCLVVQAYVNQLSQQSKWMQGVDPAMAETQAIPLMEVRRPTSSQPLPKPPPSASENLLGWWRGMGGRGDFV